MKTPLLLGALFALASGQGALAAHKGPSALFRGASPVEAIAKIAAKCEERGFAVRKAAETDVICQGGELVRSQVVFRPGSPSADPRDQAQVYHRFVAEPSPEGALVRERSTVTLALSGKLMEITPRLVAAKLINARLIEFYAALGAEVRR